MAAFLKRRFLRHAGLALFCAMLLSACEGRATPIAAVPAADATPPPASEPGQVSPSGTSAAALTIGVLRATAPLLRDEDRALLETRGALVIVDDPEQTSVDLLLGYGPFAGSTASGEVHHLLLAFQPALVPLNDASLIALLREGFDPSRAASVLAPLGAQIVANTAAAPGRVRGALASSGYPDGFLLAGLNAQAPAAEPIAAALFATGFELTLRTSSLQEALEALLAGHTQAALLLLTSTERSQLSTDIADEYLFDLALLPLHYRAAVPTSENRSPSGWVLPAPP